MSPNDADEMANSVDPDQTAPLEAVWSGSSLFAKTYLSENLGSLRYVMTSQPKIFCLNLAEEKVYMQWWIQNGDVQLNYPYFIIMAKLRIIIVNLFFKNRSNPPPFPSKF